MVSALMLRWWANSPFTQIFTTFYVKLRSRIFSQYMGKSLSIYCIIIYLFWRMKARRKLQYGRRNIARNWLLIYLGVRVPENEKWIRSDGKFDSGLATVRWYCEQCLTRPTLGSTAIKHRRLAVLTLRRAASSTNKSWTHFEVVCDVMLIMLDETVDMETDSAWFRCCQHHERWRQYSISQERTWYNVIRFGPLPSSFQ